MLLLVPRLLPLPRLALLCLLGCLLPGLLLPARLLPCLLLCLLLLPPPLALLPVVPAALPRARSLVPAPEACCSRLLKGFIYVFNIIVHNIFDTPAGCAGAAAAAGVAGLGLPQRNKV